MSSSSSDSDSDDIEPIRRIKINIKPKDHVAKRSGADVEAIKASVETWRPLGPRPHPSLTRRQSSLSSMSSLSLGTSGLNSSTTATPNSVTSASTAGTNNQYNYQYIQPPCGVGNSSGLGAGVTGSVSTATVINWGNNSVTTAASAAAGTTNLTRSSPSCSSLVNEFSNRASFSNFMSNSGSRTSSPLTFVGANSVGGSGVGGRLGESLVPIALAIQESIELTVKGQRGQPTGNMKTRFETRALGNIKVAFPNSYGRLCSIGSDKPIPSLKLRLHSTENIIRYYASGLVKDLDSENSSLAGSLQDNPNYNNNNNDVSNNISGNIGSEHSCSTSMEGSEQQANGSRYDLFDMNESPNKRKSSTKIIEFDMDALVAQLKALYDQAPASRYYNVDVLRYQIMPMDDFEKSPLQVCAYWKVEPTLIKLRVDFKHSNRSGLTLERLRDISFNVDLSNLVPTNLDIQPVPPNLVSTLITQVKQTPSPSSSYSAKNNRDGFQNLSSNSSESSLFDYNRTALTNSTAPTSASSTSLSSQRTNGLFQMPLATPPPPQPAPRQINKLHDKNAQSISQQIRLPPPPSSGHSRNHHMHSRASNLNNNHGNQVTDMETLRRQPSPFLRNQSHSSSDRSDVQSLVSGQLGQSLHDNNRHHRDTSILDQLMSTDPPMGTNNAVLAGQPAAFQHQAPPTPTIISSNQAATAQADIPTVPYITYEPQAHWNNETKQLVWRFDNLLSFYKSDGYGSLLAKLDFRQGDLAATPAINQAESQVAPNPIDIKFMVVDSTLSKIGLTIDSTGYRLSLLKKEVRSGRYKSEPYTF